MPALSSRGGVDQAHVRASAGRFAVLVTSSDRARDVFEIVYQKSEAVWRDCDWPRYVGFTSKHPDLYGFKAVAAKQPSEWRQEVCDYLDALPQKIEYVLRLDEDALFLSPVNGAELDAIADLMVQQDLVYVSLVPVRRNLPGLLVEYIRKKLNRRTLRRLSFHEPYYSSVCLAIWKRSYLRSLLMQPGSIWDFEHTITSEPHYAVWKPVLDQDQIVRAGRWHWRAPRLLAEQGLNLAGSKREFQSRASWASDLREKITFAAIGFLSFRIRRRLKKLSWQ